MRVWLLGGAGVAMYVSLLLTTAIWRGAETYRAAFTSPQQFTLIDEVPVKVGSQSAVCIEGSSMGWGGRGGNEGKCCLRRKAWVYRAAMLCDQSAHW